MCWMNSTPFPSPVVDKYFHNDFPERILGSTELFLLYNPTSDNTVILKVVMRLYSDFMNGVGRFRKYTIVELELEIMNKDSQLNQIQGINLYYLDLYYI